MARVERVYVMSLKRPCHHDEDTVVPTFWESRPTVDEAEGAARSLQREHPTEQFSLRPIVELRDLKEEDDANTQKLLRKAKKAGWGS
jgi:hypothetical protein